MSKQRNIKLNSPEFLELQQEWYRKLAQNGFHDLEWMDPQTGKGQDGPYLAKKKLIEPSHGLEYDAITEHYRLCRNFATHYPFKYPKDKFVFHLYAEGESYLEIVKKYYEWFGTKDALDQSWFKNKFRLKKLTKKAIHLFVKEWVPICYKWNKTSPNGISAADNDLFLQEVLIKEGIPFLADVPEVDKDVMLAELKTKVQN